MYQLDANDPYHPVEFDVETCSFTVIFNKDGASSRPFRDSIGQDFIMVHGVRAINGDVEGFKVFKFKKILDGCTNENVFVEITENNVEPTRLMNPIISTSMDLNVL